MVYLEGEAYFDVARDEQRPFTALSDRMNVAVLGTQFNFSTTDEAAVVTLVSGKVQVETETSETCVLFPVRVVPAEDVHKAVQVEMRFPARYQQAIEQLNSGLSFYKSKKNK